MTKKANADVAMKKPIIMVGGDKGGVGKSMICNMLVEYLLKQNIPTQLIETDTDNPDVYFILGNKVNARQVDMNVKDGWTELINLTAESDETIVINMAARLRTATEKFGANFCDDLNELKRPLVLLWAINRQRDCIVLLKNALANLPCIKNTIVIKNLYFGEAGKFVLFDESKTKSEVEENKGVVINFPELGDKITDHVANKRMSFIDCINKATESGLRFGEQRDLQRWINDVFTVFDGIKGRMAL